MKVLEVGDLLSAVGDSLFTVGAVFVEVRNVKLQCNDT